MGKASYVTKKNTNNWRAWKNEEKQESCVKDAKYEMKY